MTFTTTNGIRYPDDPNAYADIIQYFKDMAEDVDSKFVSNKAATATMAGALTSKWFIASNGGGTQSSTVFQTGTDSAQGFNIFDDKQRIDGSDGRRLWISGAHNQDVAIRTRNTTEKLNKISLEASKLELNGAVTINGTLNVTNTKTQQWAYEGNQNLPHSTGTNWPATPGAAGFSFVAPPSGAVTIGYGGMVPSGTASTKLSYRVGEGATVGSGNEVLAYNPTGWTDQPPPQSINYNGTSNAGATWASLYTAFLLTGSTSTFQKIKLVGGQTYNVKPYYYNSNTETLVLYRHYFIVTPDY